MFFKRTEVRFEEICLISPGLPLKFFESHVFLLETQMLQERFDAFIIHVRTIITYKFIRHVIVAITRLRVCGVES
jgi:hypothetical protein